MGKSMIRIDRSIIPWRLVDAVKRRPALHRRLRRLRASGGRLLPARRYPGIPGRIHPNDFMFGPASADEIASYAERAGNVITNIEDSIAAGGRTIADVERWLDFGCGYGRVVRYLVESVPPERISAADVIEEAVDFCSSEFGVRPVHVRPDLGSADLGDYDVIYAISVLSHLNEANSVSMLRLLGDSLRLDGIALFTSHGRTSLDDPGLYGSEFAARRDEIAVEVEQNGMAFVPYAFTGSDDYGMAWHATAWVEETMRDLHGSRIKLIRFVPAGLDGHQDVFAFQRVA